MDSYALLVWQDGALRHVEYSPPYDAELRPESASMHKSILALVVGAAIDDGAIGSVDDPVETYLPEWRGNARGQITIRTVNQCTAPADSNRLFLEVLGEPRFGRTLAL